MNHIFRLVWHRARSEWRVAPELSRRRTKGGSSRKARAAQVGTLVLPLVAAAPMALAGPAVSAISVFTKAPTLAPTAHPVGGQVTAGQGTIEQRGSTTTITQSSQDLSLSWLSFDIGSQATVDFVQPSASAIAVNRIGGSDGSIILGHLNANGQIFLINPNGVLFGKSAQVNVGGLVASTLDVSDGSLGSNSLSFAGQGKGSVVNQGRITAAKGGYVALLGNTVSNQGVIHAQLGSVALAGGSGVTLSFDGDRLVNVRVDKSALDALVQNGQLIEAEGGNVWMTASARDSLLANAVNNTGAIDAQGVSTAGGVVRLVASGGDTADSGSINVSGTHGGTVQVLSNQNVGVTGDINAAGTQGGGNIRVGGGYQGGEGLPTAGATYVGSSAHLDADASQAGNGGTVVVWGNHANNFLGHISARGGAQSGNGGQVETSAHTGLNAQGQVDASAPNGEAGSWLLDPYDVTIQTGGASFSNPYTATATSTIDPANIDTALTGGTDVFVFTNTQGTGSGNGDITVMSQIQPSGAGSLYLEAAGSIFLDNQIYYTGSGSLNVYLWANYGGSAAGKSYTQNSSCASSTSCVVNLQSATITIPQGDIDIETSGHVTVDSSSGIVFGAGTLTISAGTGITAAGLLQGQGAVTLDAGQGAISATNGLNNLSGAVSLSNSGPYDATVSNGGFPLTLGPVSVGGSLSANANITLTQNVISGGGQTYQNSVTLAADTTLMATNGPIAFDGSVDGGHALTVATGGNVDFSRPVGSLTPLTSLTVSGSAVSLGGGVSTIGAQNYTGTLSFGGLSTTLAGSTVAVVSPLSQPAENLTISGAAVLDGSVDLASLAVSGGTTLRGNVTTSGAQSYGASTQILAGVTLDSTGTGGGVDFGGNVTDANSLTVEAPNGDVAFHSSGGFYGLTTQSSTFTAAGALTIAPGGLSVTTTGGPIDQGAAFSVAGTSSFNAGSQAITLSNAGNQFGGAVSLSGGTTAIDNGVALTLGTVSTGALTAVSAGALDLGAGTVAGTLTAIGSGLISQDGALNVTGAVSVTQNNTTAGTGQDVLLLVAGNDFESSVTLAAGAGAQINDLTLTNSATVANALSLPAAIGGNLTLNYATSLALPALSVGGMLSVAANGISQTGPVSVTGTSIFTAGSNAITLTNAGNDFQGAITLTGGTTAIFNGTALTIDALDTGALTAVSGGALVLGTGRVVGSLTAAGSGLISQSGALNVTGAVSITQNNATAGGTGQDIVLDSANAFDDAVSFSAGSGAQIGNLSFRNDVSISGALSLPVSVAGNLTLNYGVATLTLPAIAIGGSLDATAGQIVIAGNLSTGGGQTYHGPVDLTGNTTLASTGGGTIGFASTIFGSDVLTLDTAGAVTLAGQAILTGLDATGGSFTAGELNIGSGGLAVVTSGGAISQTGAFAVNGASSFDAGNQAITLTNAGNDLAGAVTLDGGDVALANADPVATQLGASSVSGTLTLDSGAPITQSGALLVAGTSQFDAGSLPITLTNAGNDFQGAVSLTGGTTTILDGAGLTLGTVNTGALTASSAGALDLGGGTITGALNATAGGSVAQSGALVVSGSATITSGGALTLASLSASSVIAQATSDLSIASGGSVTAADSGDSLELVAGNRFINGAGSAALSAPQGSWLIWSQNPADDTLDGLLYGFKQYGATYGTSSVQGVGNGVLYTLAPVLTASVTGSVAKPYDGTAAATLSSANFSVSGLVAPDAVTLSGTGTYDAPDAGTRTVTASGVVFSASQEENGVSIPVYGYQLSGGPVSGVGTIAPVPLTVTANDVAKIYDGVAYRGGNGVTYSGFVAGQGASVLGGSLSYGGPAEGALNAGRYALTPGGLTSANYTITYVNGTLTVSPATLTYVASPLTVDLGSVPALGGTVVGFVSGDSLANATTGTLSFSSPATAQVGHYPIDGGGLTADHGNYVFVQAPQNATALTVVGEPIALVSLFAGLESQGAHPVRQAVVASSGFAPMASREEATSVGSSSNTTYAAWCASGIAPRDLCVPTVRVIGGGLQQSE